MQFAQKAQPLNMKHDQLDSFDNLINSIFERINYLCKPRRDAGRTPLIRSDGGSGHTPTFTPPGIDPLLRHRGDAMTVNAECSGGHGADVPPTGRHSVLRHTMVPAQN
ncbi:hypothetical protein [Rhodococcus opacus]|uniref:hypothetical protein n=1 Tax=Rhodococcus opacus TaxID=37919 RepID=UPI0013DAC484|nr:hypothetical protein [Rhodococcus opacus]MDV7089610.1 hypothetical protein [Rhodococcus opacus]